MPGPQDFVSDFEKGQILTANDLNMIVQRLRALMPAESGGFVNSVYTVKRPQHAPAGAVLVAITSTIEACAWDKVNKRKTPVTASMPVWTSASDGNGETFDVNTKITFNSPWATQITVSAGKFRIGMVIDGQLGPVDCTELDMP